MSQFIPLIDPAGVIRLGWTLVHFIWQGFAVGLLLALALGLRREVRPQWRYAAACFALLLLAATPVATFFSPLARPGGVAHALTAAPMLPVALPAAVSTALSAPVLGPVASPGRGTEGWLPLLVAIWVVGVIGFIARLLTGWWGLRRLRTSETSQLGEPWRARLVGLAARVGVTRPVALLESALVEVPTVLGWLRPVILLPASTLTGLTPAQIDAILVHELAHIRRHDYLVNWAQHILEALLFYHPVVWWVSRRIREERELCCDDIAVAVCGDPVNYARALASLEELRTAPGELALAADGGSLLARIQRLLGVTPNPTRAKRVRVIGLLLVGAGLCAFALNYDPRPRYEAKLRVVVYPDSKATPFDFAKLLNFTNSPAGTKPAAPGSDGAPSPLAYDPAWIATEIEVMRSSVVLDKIVFQLDLGYKLRMRDQDKSPRPNGWAGNILRDRVRLRQVPGTSMVEVTATGEDEAEARAIAESVVRAYLEFRGEQQNKAALARLKELDSLQDQLDRRLKTLMRVTVPDQEASDLPGAEDQAASYQAKWREREVISLQDAYNATTMEHWRLHQGRPVVNPELAVIVDRFPVVAKGGLLW